VGAVVSPPPLVGVSTSEVRSAGARELVAQGEPPRTELALGERYLEAVRAAGGMPVILAPVGPEAIDQLLGRLDAVCLSGGPDLHPSAYGVLPHPELGPTERELDQFELELAGGCRCSTWPSAARSTSTSPTSRVS
jgi:putative glutamine amidotransferase